MNCLTSSSLLLTVTFVGLFDNQGLHLVTKIPLENKYRFSKKNDKTLYHLRSCQKRSDNQVFHQMFQQLKKNYSQSTP